MNIDDSTNPRIVMKKVLGWELSPASCGNNVPTHPGTMSWRTTLPEVPQPSMTPGSRGSISSSIHRRPPVMRDSPALRACVLVRHQLKLRAAGRWSSSSCRPDDGNFGVLSACSWIFETLGLLQVAADLVGAAGAGVNLGGLVTKLSECGA